MPTLAELGWGPAVEASFEPHARAGLLPARVAAAHRTAYGLLGPDGPLGADVVVGEVAGRLRHEARSPADLPAVGDWVAVSPRPGEARATIRAVLPRSSRFSRKVPGAVVEEQVVAANVDVALLVVPLDRPPGARRLERALTLAWESGASPAVVLSKADLDDRVADHLAEAGQAAPGVPVLAASALTGAGLDDLGSLVRGRTSVLVGASGSGKSSLVNALLGTARQDTGPLRAHDGRGQHTTTCRELLLLPGGGLVIDTPGLRELGLWAEGGALDSAFEDVATLARGCRFTDCRHDAEPGCAVLSALEEGRLDEGRWESYRRLGRELRFLAAKQDVRARLDRRREIRARTRGARSRGDAE